MKQLRWLDLRKMSYLERLEIRAPLLLGLDLQDCKRLNDCQIHCPTLQRVNLQGSRTVALRFCKNVRQVLVQSWSRACALQQPALQ